LPSDAGESFKHDLGALSTGTPLINKRRIEIHHTTNTWNVLLSPACLTDLEPQVINGLVLSGPFALGAQPPTSALDI
jgi:hypothetical protein